MDEYLPVPQGQYRNTSAEYQLCKSAGIDDWVEKVAYSARCELMSHHSQTHVILDGALPSEDVVKVFEQVKKGSQELDPEAHIPKLMPYTHFTMADMKDFHKAPSYDKFYQETADTILDTEWFCQEERYADMAKWIKHNYDRFVTFKDAHELYHDGDDYDRIQNLSKQVFMNAKRDGFSRNLDKFIHFFGDYMTNIHPVIHLGSDAPVFNKEGTRELIERFHSCIDGMGRDTMRSQFDGEANTKKLDEYIKNFDRYCTDENPEELKALADAANRIYSAEWSFMYQGANRNITLILPRWAITLEEEFSGNWRGSYHPLLTRGCNASAYNEEATYIDYLRW